VARLKTQAECRMPRARHEQNKPGATGANRRATRTDIMSKANNAQVRRAVVNCIMQAVPRRIRADIEQAAENDGITKFEVILATLRASDDLAHWAESF